MAVYTLRYGRSPGIYAVLSEDLGYTWDMEGRLQLYDARGNTTIGIREEGSELQSMMGYAFGMPHAVRLGDGTIMAVYWCTEGCITHIRWSRIGI